MVDYPKPSLTVDAVVLAGQGDQTRLLVIRRRNPPFAGQFALPGGFVDPGELPFHACLRELIEETGLALDYPEVIPLTLRAKPGRDPRGWTLSQPFLLWLPETQKVTAGDDADRAMWVPLNQLESLAFDHGAILCEALACFWPSMPSHRPALRHVEGFGVANNDTMPWLFFGGSFNPWHQGHEEAVRQGMTAGQVIVIRDSNPFKPPTESDCSWAQVRRLSERVSTYSAAVYPGFCGMELSNPTVRWLPLVHNQPRCLLIGGDSLVSLPSWREAQRLIKSLNQLWVLPRNQPASAREQALHWIKQHAPTCTVHIMNDHPYRKLSSSELRHNKP